MIKLPSFSKIYNLKKNKNPNATLAILAVGGLLLFVGTGYTWYTQIFSNTDRVFYDMVAKGLETNSVSRVTTQSEAGQKAEQSYYISFSPNTVLESSSKVEQTDPKTNEKSSVTIKTIANKDSDYVSYSEMIVPKSAGQKNDFSKVLNQWAKQERDDKTGEKPQFLQEAIVTIIPFGNLSQENHSDLVKLIKQREVYSFKEGEISYQNGKPVMTIDVSIKPKALVEVLRQYTKVTGIGDLESLNPAEYEKVPDLSVQLKVDMISRHLLEINFPGQTRKETYGAYGLNRKVTIPSNTITLKDLQSRIQVQN